tara:strand:- start:403 stop:1248 length:846 start_codon:yes stop_codon:yes gene_type:complete
MGRKGNSGYSNPDRRFGKDLELGYSGSLGFTQHYLERLDGDLEPTPPQGAPAAGFTIWLKADSGITLNGTSAVSEWADQSTNQIDFSQSTTSAQPTFTSANTILNNQPSVDFFNNDFLESDDNPVMNTTTGFCIYIVAKLNSFPSTFSGFFGRTNGTSWSTGWFSFYYASKLRFCIDYWNTSTKRVELDPPNVSNVNIYKFHYDRTTITGQIIGPDADLDTQAQTTSDINATGNGVELNRLGSSAYDGSWDFGEFIYYNTPLNSAGQTETENYLKTKYGIT